MINTIHYHFKNRFKQRLQNQAKFPTKSARKRLHAVFFIVTFIFSLFLEQFLLPQNFSTALAATEKVSVKPVQPFYEPLDKGETPLYEPSVTYISPLKELAMPFSSIGASWHQQVPVGTSLELSIRVRTKNRFSEWYILEPTIDFKDEQNKNQDTTESYPTALFSTNQSDAFQYRIILKTEDQSKTPLIDQLSFTFINGGTPQEKTNLAKDALKKIEDDSENFIEIKEEENFSLTPKNIGIVQASVLSANASDLIAYESPKTPAKTKRKVISKSSGGALKIISRKEWGADESLRLYREEGKEAKLVALEDDYYEKFKNELKIVKTISTDDKGNNLAWPLTYPEKVTKIVIHHTATTKNLEDPKRAIRDIYYWHTITKGWGDIGYNYIIDQQGNIYEGRFGGESVIGAHAGKGNNGSIGIAILGNYQTEDPPEPVITALVSLLKAKTQKYQIDPEGASLFRGEKYNNIMGHRDIMSTSCPGDRVYAMLPILRKMVKTDFTIAVDKTKNLSNDYNLTFAEQPQLAVFEPKGKKTITFKIKNTGTKSWDANTYFQINPTSDAKTFLKDAEKILTSKVGKEIKPNQIATVQVTAFANKTGGSALMEIGPVINGKTPVERYLRFPIQVKTPAPKPKYDYDLLSIIYDKSPLKKGETVTATIKIRNKGVQTWQKNGQNKLMLGSDEPRDHYNNLLVTPSARLAGMEEDLVKYNELATFKVKLKVPNEDGTYIESFTPVVEGVTWLNHREDSYLELKVGNEKAKVIKNSQSSSSNVTTKPEAGTATSKPGTNGVNQSSKNIADSSLDLNKKPTPIRVDLAYRGNPVVISANGNFSLYEGSKQIASFEKDNLVNIEYKEGKFTVNFGQKKWEMTGSPRLVPASGIIMRIENWERRNTWGDKANNNEFRGTLEVLIYDKELHVINELPLEDYIKGIAEESSEDPKEKIKAIMIIARTYARFYTEVATKFPGAPFHLNDDPNYSQKYIGYSFEKRSPVTAQIAQDTKGMYLTYKGKLIKTPYFSQSNGATISASEKWGWTDTPFLQSVKDTFCGTTEYKGHGVGLSGCGAKKLAEQGKTFQEILKYYYSGVEVSQANY